MSLADRFVYAGRFPFCPEDLSGSVVFPIADSNYVGNLTPAEVMGFYWNLETFTLTFTGTAADSGSGESVNATGTFTLSPPASTLFTRMGVNGSAMHGAGTGMLAMASAPSVRAPRERVCNPESFGVSRFRTVELFLDDGPGVTAASGFLSFSVSTDPLNAGRYRIYYYFALNFESLPVAGARAEVRWTHFSASTAPYTPITSGTISIGGISFTWYSAYVGTSYTGGTLSATSSDFSY